MITVTLYSVPTPTVEIAEHPSYLGVCTFVCISEGTEDVGVCV